MVGANQQEAAESALVQGAMAAPASGTTANPGGQLPMERPVTLPHLSEKLYKSALKAWKAINTVYMYPATFETAKAECLSKNGSISIIPSFNTNKEHFITLWLPIVRQKQKRWVWTNKKQFRYKRHSVGLPQNYPLGYDCAVVRTVDTFVDIDRCHRRNGFICEHIGYENCPSKAECYQRNDRNLTVHRRYITWYEARNACRKKGYDLATFEGEDLQVVSSWLHETLPTDGHFWIGLTRSVWTLQALFRSSKIISQEPAMYNWDEGEPSSSGNCVIVSTATFLWKATSCSSKHRSVCQSPVTAPSPSEVSSTNKLQVQILQDQTKEGNCTQQTVPAVSKSSESSVNSSSCLATNEFVGYAVYLLMITHILVIGFIIIKRTLCLCHRKQIKAHVDSSCLCFGRKPDLSHRNTKKDIKEDQYVCKVTFKVSHSKLIIEDASVEKHTSNAETPL